MLMPESSLGFFGIVQDTNKDVYAASREILGFSLKKKLSSDVILYKINPVTLYSEPLATLRKVYDVHQIALWKDNMYLSNSTKDVVHVFNVISKKLTGEIHLGSKRVDIHHANALLVDGEFLLVGLNNRGFCDSQVLFFPLTKTPLVKGEIVDALKTGTIKEVPGFQHTHDLEKCNGKILLCASKEGLLVQMEDGRSLFHTDGFLRGIAEDEHGIWLGVSQMAPRKERHYSQLDGSLLLVDKKDYSLIKKFVVPGAGQVFDIIHVL